MLGKGSPLSRPFIPKSLCCFEYPVWYLLYWRHLINICRWLVKEWVNPQRTFNIWTPSSFTVSLARPQPSIMGSARVESQSGSHGYVCTLYMKVTKGQSPITYISYLSECFYVNVRATHVCVWGGGYVCMNMHMCRGQSQPQMLLLGSHPPLLCWVRFSS